MLRVLSSFTFWKSEAGIIGLEYDVHAFPVRLPRLHIIGIGDFDPMSLLKDCGARRRSHDTVRHLRNRPTVNREEAARAHCLFFQAARRASISSCEESVSSSANWASRLEAASSACPGPGPPGVPRGPQATEARL